jgi:hypothetical protein
LLGTSPPARPAISMAMASECPDPNALTTPPARSDATTAAAARRTGSSCVSAT